MGMHSTMRKWHSNNIVVLLAEDFCSRKLSSTVDLE